MEKHNLYIGEAIAPPPTHMVFRMGKVGPYLKIQGRTQDSNFQGGGGGGGGGGQVFPIDGVPSAHNCRNPLSLMISQLGGRSSRHYPPLPFGSILAYPKMEWASAVGV